MFGDFAMDERRYQIGHEAITTRWQEGKEVGEEKGDILNFYA